MKPQTIINIVLGAAVVVNFCLHFRNPDPVPPGDAVYDTAVGEADQRIQKIDSVFKVTDHEIDTNSVFVHTAKRSTRDSLRAILNPR